MTEGTKAATLRPSPPVLVDIHHEMGRCKLTDSLDMRPWCRRPSEIRRTVWRRWMQKPVRPTSESANPRSPDHFGERRNQADDARLLARERMHVPARVGSKSGPGKIGRKTFGFRRWLIGSFAGPERHPDISGRTGRQRRVIASAAYRPQRAKCERPGAAVGRPPGHNRRRPRRDSRPDGQPAASERHRHRTSRPAKIRSVASGAAMQCAAGRVRPQYRRRERHSPTPSRPANRPAHRSAPAG